MITDEQIRYVVWKAATLFHQKCQNGEVYLYQYSYKGTYGTWLVWGMDGEGNGPSHFDECFVMFKNKVHTYSALSKFGIQGTPFARAPRLG